MRIAVPTKADAFCEHFGRSDGFFICEADQVQAQQPRIIPRPKSKCESVPQWLRKLGVTTILAGGMGEVARHHFAELGIAVSVGHRGSDPAAVVAEFLTEAGKARPNPCADFEHHHHHCRSKRPATGHRRST